MESAASRWSQWLEQSWCVCVCFFLCAGVIQELQLKLRERCSQAPPASANFRPAPGTVCCALFSGTSSFSSHSLTFTHTHDRHTIIFLNRNAEHVASPATNDAGQNCFNPNTGLASVICLKLGMCQCRHVMRLSLCRGQPVVQSHRAGLLVLGASVCGVH